MEIVRIPARFNTQIGRLSKDDQLWVFQSLLTLASGENVELKDSFAGDTLQQIWRESVLMEKKNVKTSDYVGGDCVATYTALTPHAKVKESKVNESKVNILCEKTFEVFWNIYPKKVGKGDAKKSWMKLNPDEELCKKIAIAIRQQMEQKQWKEEKGRYIPNPATWLNQERWNDEPVTVQHKPFFY